MDIENRNDGDTVNSLSDDVAAVFNIIKEFHATQPKAEDYSKQPANKKRIMFITISIAISFFIITILLTFLPGTTLESTNERIRLITQLFVISVYVVGGLVILFKFNSIKSFFSDPAGSFLDGMGDLASYEVTMFEQFDELSIESIQYVAKRLQSSSTQFNRLRSFLVGAIEKVGIIPGLIASALALSKVASSSGFSWLEVVSFLLVLLYALMFPLMEASIKFERYALILEEYLECKCNNEY